MRRFIMGSIVAAVIGLMLAGAGYWAYWNFYSRFQPVTISRNPGEVQRLLDEASWVSDGSGGQPLYIVTYRDSAAGHRYLRDEAPKLKAAGVETRFILFARPDAEGASRSTAAERATVAELWLSRDWPLYERWMATPSNSWTAAGLPQADGNLARSAVVEAGRRFDEQLGRLLRESGVKISYPLILWRDRDGFLKACGCADSRAWAFIRDDVGAPDRLGAPTSGAPGPDEDQIAPEGPPSAMPYPDLPAIPPVNPQNGSPVAPPAQAQNPTQTPTRQASPSSRPSPRAAPAPTQQEDTTFY
ncbi:hypothetical protein [Brevundimonas sp.]|uniref:hypothetical protein n=1 Tax=Brevundimonas sp. TaxID=1871086 RepID=UPI002896B5D4|nr:hypothetical protein [Brevundimonas sp.]